MSERRMIDANELTERILNLDITVSGRSAEWKAAKLSVIQEIAQSKIYPLPERYAEITDDFILALTAVMHYCIKHGKPTQVSTYIVDNELLGKRQIKVYNALYLLDNWLCELAKKEGKYEKN